jgi:hypothetical protein
MSWGSSPGWRKVGTMSRATFPSVGYWRRPRPVIWTISTGELLVSARTTPSAPPAADVVAFAQHLATGNSPGSGSR